MGHDEYQALRAEMLTHFEIINQHYIAAILATGAILSIALASDNTSPWLRLAPLVVIVPLAFNYAMRSEAFTRIGSYIQVFHEGSGSPGWERRITQIAPKLGAWGFTTRLSRFAYTLTFPGLGMLCLALFAFDPRVAWPIRLAVGLAVFAALAIIEHRLLTAPLRRSLYLQLWREVANAEAEPPEGDDPGPTLRT